MKAIYKGKLYSVVNDSMAGLKLQSLDDQKTKWVLYSDEDLIIDPTDDEINNILPDYPDEPPPETNKERETREREWMRSMDEMVGCNVHGRLTCILTLLDGGDLPSVRLELERLLKFFPKP